MPEATPDDDAAWRELRAALLDPATLVRAVASGRRRSGAPAWRRVELRPVSLAAGPRLQVTRYDERQAFTANHDWADAGPDGAAAVVDTLLGEPFGHWNVRTVTHDLRLRVTKRDRALLGREPRLGAGSGGPQLHDRVKARLLDPADPYLQAVGISDATGRVKPSRQDKYRQVEEFLRLLSADLDDAVSAGRVAPPSADRPLRVVDLGCGNAYLTFAAVAWLRATGRPAEVVGVDVKDAARQRNTALADQLGWGGSMRFVAAGIVDAAWTFPTHRPGVDDTAPDVVLALHACDTATDDALARAVRAGAPLVLAAPCCHHDLQRQLKACVPAAEDVPLLRFGILRERFGDVLTDALRAHLLRLLGHRVDVVEFVASRHTPRNVLLRAHRTGAAADPAAWAEYDALLRRWGVRPALAQRLFAELAAARPAPPVPLATLTAPEG